MTPALSKESWAAAARAARSAIRILIKKGYREAAHVLTGRAVEFERRAQMTDHKPGDVPVPSRERLVLALHAAELGTHNKEDLEEMAEAARWALRNLPENLDFIHLVSQNPLSQVSFRAGLLACREYMARFVEQGGDAATAALIRANWWPVLGADPGAPRLFNFDEVAEEGGTEEKPTYRSKLISASVEALPRAYQFLQWATSASPHAQAQDE